MKHLNNNKLALLFFALSIYSLNSYSISLGYKSDAPYFYGSGVDFDLRAHPIFDLKVVVRDLPINVKNISLSLLNIDHSIDLDLLKELSSLERVTIYLEKVPANLDDLPINLTLKTFSSFKESFPLEIYKILPLEIQQMESDTFFFWAMRQEVLKISDVTTCLPSTKRISQFFPNLKKIIFKNQVKIINFKK